MMGRLTHRIEIYNFDYDKNELTYLDWLPYEDGHVAILISNKVRGQIEFKQEYLN